jgi:class I fructose-bisphosphate aldolase
MRRLGKVFHSDGKSVIVAMDHGMGMPVNPALDHIGDVLRSVVKGGADAILTTFGIAEKFIVAHC